ncbi:hypothetical protein BC940DRAFT_15609 [Gongronella butleri]|nr:hypothetical protein BC940DRAFT_15609 [Gongronella butleri]
MSLHDQPARNRWASNYRRFLRNIRVHHRPGGKALDAPPAPPPLTSFPAPQPSGGPTLVVPTSVPPPSSNSEPTAATWRSAVPAAPPPAALAPPDPALTPLADAAATPSTARPPIAPIAPMITMTTPTSPPPLFRQPSTASAISAVSSSAPPIPIPPSSHHPHHYPNHQNHQIHQNPHSHHHARAYRLSQRSESIIHPPPPLSSSPSSVRSSIPPFLSVSSTSSSFFHTSHVSTSSSSSQLDDDDDNGDGNTPSGAADSLRSAHSGSMLDDLSTRVHRYRFSTPTHAYHPRDAAAVATAEAEDDDDASRFSFDPQRPPHASNASSRQYAPSSIQSTTAGATGTLASAATSPFPSFFRSSFLRRSKKKSILPAHLPDFETLVYCSACDKWVQSRLRYRSGAMVWLAGLVLLLCTVFLFWIPFCINYFKGKKAMEYVF